MFLGTHPLEVLTLAPLQMLIRTAAASQVLKVKGIANKNKVFKAQITATGPRSTATITIKNIIKGIILSQVVIHLLD